MKKILVVDDNYDILNVISLILEMEGYQVGLCDNGTHALSKSLEFAPDLIRLDIMLGDHDGRDICKNIKTLDQTAHIPIIMISASHTLLSIIDSECPAEGFLAKPFEIGDLVGTVQKYLD